MNVTQRHAIGGVYIDEPRIGKERGDYLESGVNCIDESLRSDGHLS